MSAKFFVAKAVLFLLMAVSLVVAQDYKPTPEMKKLDYFVGEWKGELVFHPCQWWPKGGVGNSRVVVVKTLNSRFLKIDYSSSKKDGIVYRAQQMMTWDPRSKAYRYWEFDTLGLANHLYGQFVDNTLTLNLNSASYRQRLTYKILSPNRYTLIVENAIAKDPLQKIITATCTRVIAKPNKVRTLDVTNSEEKKAVTNVIHSLLDTFATKDIDAVMRFYGPGAVSYWSSGKIVTGKKQHRDSYLQGVAEVENFKSKWQPEIVSVSENTAWTVGKLSWTATVTSSGDIYSVHNRSTFILNKVGTRWLIVHEHSSRILAKKIANGK